MIEYSLESFSDIVEDLKPIFEEHSSEVDIYQDVISLNPDYGTFITLDKLDKLRLIVARDKGRIVGYSMYVVNEHLHYKDHKYAVNDILFLDKEYRGGYTALELLDYAEAVLSEEGVSVITMNMKTHAKFETLMESLDYDRAEILYTKYIGA